MAGEILQNDKVTYEQFIMFLSMLDGWLKQHYVPPNNCTLLPSNSSKGLKTN